MTRACLTNLPCLARTYCLVLSLSLPLLSITPAAAQTFANPGAASRYAPPQGQAAQSAQRQGQGPVRTAQGPAPQQGVRPVAGQEPIRQPANTEGSLPRSAGPAVIPLNVNTGPTQPSWAPLDQAHEKWIGDILRFWEERSNKIKALECKFTRWEYDPVFGPRQADVAKTIAKGEIKYQSPDKGLFKVTELALYSPPAKEGAEAQYVPQDISYSEHWVCDGERVFEFDGRNKRVIERELPPDMKGKAITDGPLPFLFGARAETIKARYWIRGLPEGGKGQYWLEAVPKSRSDAQNFKQVVIVLDEATFLPVLLRVYAPNFNPKTNPAYTSYQFSDHDVTDDKLNAAAIIGKLNLFKTAFFAPTTPAGWKRVVERAGAAPAPPNVPGALEATRPQTPPRNTQLPR